MAGSKLQKYIDLFKNLLPPGRLWNPTEQPVFLGLITSIIGEFCRVDDRVDDLLANVDPRTTDEAADQWQEFLGLPDECTPEDQTLDEVRTQLVQKLTNVGGISQTFYEFIAGQLGFPDTAVKNWTNFTAGSLAGDPLTNYWDRHFVAGSQCGNQLQDIGWMFYFNVDMPASASEHFVAGSECGNPLRLFSNELLECTFKKIKPAYAGVTFSFFE